MRERQAYALTALKVVMVAALAAETAAYFLGAGAVVWIAGLMTIAAAITGQTIESSSRRREGSR